MCKGIRLIVVGRVMGKDDSNRNGDPTTTNAFSIKHNTDQDVYDVSDKMKDWHLIFSYQRR